MKQSYTIPGYNTPTGLLYEGLEVKEGYLSIINEPTGWKVKQYIYIGGRQNSFGTNSYDIYMPKWIFYYLGINLVDVEHDMMVRFIIPPDLKKIDKQPAASSLWDLEQKVLIVGIQFENKWHELSKSYFDQALKDIQRDFNNSHHAIYSWANMIKYAKAYHKSLSAKTDMAHEYSFLDKYFKENKEIIGIND